MRKEMMFRSKIASILGLDGRTVTKYVREAHLDGYPKDSRQPKYDIYEVAALFGYTKTDVQRLMKEAQ